MTTTISKTEKEQIKHYNLIKTLTTLEAINKEISDGAHKTTLISEVLSYAGENKLNFELFKKLIDDGADINNGLLILKLACYEYWEATHYLIEKGAKIDVKNEVLLELVSYSGNHELIDLLLKKGFSLHRNNEIVLSEAIVGEKINTIDYLLSLGCDLNKCLKNHHFYITSKEVLEFLIEKNANLDILKEHVQKDLEVWLDMMYLTKDLDKKLDKNKNTVAKKIKL
jgi:ankyrin repeat protein